MEMPYLLKFNDLAAISLKNECFSHVSNSLIFKPALRVPKKKVKIQV